MQKQNSYEFIVDCPDENGGIMYPTIYGSTILKEEEQELVVDVFRVKQISNKPEDEAKEDMVRLRFIIEDTKENTKYSIYPLMYVSCDQTDVFEIFMQLKGSLIITKDINISLSVPAGVRYEIEFIPVKTTKNA